MTSCVTKATPIYFFDGKRHIKKLKSIKSCKTCLTNHARSISHHITSLVINSLGGGHLHTHIPTHEPKQFQETRCVPAASRSMPGLKKQVKKHWFGFANPEHN